MDCVRILSACEQENKSCDLSFFKTELFLECVFVLLVGIKDRIKNTSAVVTHIPLWKNMFLPYVACTCGYKLYSCDSS